MSKDSGPSQALDSGSWDSYQGSDPERSQPDLPGPARKPQVMPPPSQSSPSQPKVIMTPAPSLHASGWDDAGNPSSSRETSSAVSSGRTEMVRQRVLQEIMDSEKRYIGHLELFDSKFREAFLGKTKVAKVKGVSELIRSPVFTVIPSLLQTNKSFLAELTAAMDGTGKRTVPQVFLLYSKLMRAYSDYVDGMEVTKQLLDQLVQQSKTFHRWLTKTQLDTELKGQTLTSLMIMPVQRIPRYELLLRELIKYTDTTCPEYTDLEKASQAIRALALDLNERKRRAEMAARFRTLSACLTNLPSSFGLITPTRTFVEETDLSFEDKALSQGTLQSHLFLFSDLVLLAQPRKHGKYAVRRAWWLALLKVSTFPEVKLGMDTGLLGLPPGFQLHYVEDDQPKAALAQDSPPPEVLAAALAPDADESYFGSGVRAVSLFFSDQKQSDNWLAGLVALKKLLLPPPSVVLAKVGGGLARGSALMARPSRSQTQSPNPGSESGRLSPHSRTVTPQMATLDAVSTSLAGSHPQPIPHPDFSRRKSGSIVDITGSRRRGKWRAFRGGRSSVMVGGSPYPSQQTSSAAALTAVVGTQPQLQLPVPTGSSTPKMHIRKPSVTPSMPSDTPHRSSTPQFSRRLSRGDSVTLGPAGLHEHRDGMLTERPRRSPQGTPDA